MNWGYKNKNASPLADFLAFRKVVTVFYSLNLAIILLLNKMI